MAEPIVLVPVDGSKHAEAALAYLPALKAFGVFRVTLVQVIREEAESEEARRYLAELAEQTSRRYALKVRWISRYGAPAEILARLANQSIAVLLMSSHGHSHIEPWRLGSVADKVIRRASCPTLVISPVAASTRAPGSFRHLLVPLDGSTLAEEALPVAAAIARKTSASLRLLSAYLPSPVAPIPNLRGNYRDHLESSAQAAEEYLASVPIEPSLADLVERAAVHGHPAEVLLREIEESAIDLVVMTSHGRGGFMRWVLGSVTDRVIRGPAPVLAIRPGRSDRLLGILEGTPTSSLAPLSNFEQHDHKRIGNPRSGAPMCNSSYAAFTLFVFGCCRHSCQRRQIALAI